MNNAESDATSPRDDRRRLRFQSLDEVLTEVSSLVDNAPVRTVGSWTLAQIVSHLADTINGSIDGMPHEGQVERLDPRMKAMTLRRGLPAGFVPPEPARVFLPRPEVDLDDAVDRLRQAVARADHEHMQAVHPFLGEFTDEEWRQFHLRHAELHLSFVWPGEESPSES